MFRDKLNFLISNRNKENVVSSDKKKIENLVVFIVILIITIFIINMICNDDNKKTNSKNKINDQSKQLALDNTDENVELSIENKLKGILETIQGVGKVNVFLNYSETSETVAMYNENSKTSTTEETDTSGGKRVIEQKDMQKDIVYQENNGDKIPITKKKIQPKIEGAIITAEGAKNALVKTNIIQAVEAVTGLATHKIQVFEMTNLNF